MHAPAAREIQKAERSPQERARAAHVDEERNVTLVQARMRSEDAAARYIQRRTRGWLAERAKAERGGVAEEVAHAEAAPASLRSPPPAGSGYASESKRDPELQLNQEAPPSPSKPVDYLGHGDEAAAQMEDFATMLAAAFGMAPTPSSDARQPQNPAPHAQGGPLGHETFQSHSPPPPNAVQTLGRSEVSDTTRGATSPRPGSRRESFETVEGGARSVSFDAYSSAGKSDGSRSKLRSPPPPPRQLDDSDEAGVQDGVGSVDSPRVHRTSRSRLRSPPPGAAPGERERQGAHARGLALGLTIDVDVGDSDAAWRTPVDALEAARAASAGQHDSGSDEVGPIGSPVLHQVIDHEDDMDEGGSSRGHDGAHTPDNGTDGGSQMAAFERRQREMQQRLAELVARPESGMGSSPCSSVALGQGGLGLGTPRGGVDRARGGPFSETPEEHSPLPPDSPGAAYAGAPRASARRFSSPGILYAQSPLGREQGPRGRRGHGKSPQRMKYRDDDIDSDSNAEKDGSETSGFTDGDSHADILQVNPEYARAWADGSTDEDAPRKQRDRKTRLRQHGGKPARRGSNTKQVPPERVNGARRVPGKQAKERRGGVKGAAQSARDAWGPAPKGKDKYGRSFEEPRRRRPPADPPASGKENRAVGGGSVVGVHGNKVTRVRIERAQHRTRREHEQRERAKQPFKAKPMPSFDMRALARSSSGVHENKVMRVRIERAQQRTRREHEQRERAKQPFRAKPMPRFDTRASAPSSSYAYAQPRASVQASAAFRPQRRAGHTRHRSGYGYAYASAPEAPAGWARRGGGSSAGLGVSSYAAQHKWRGISQGGGAYAADGTGYAPQSRARSGGYDVRGAHAALDDEAPYEQLGANQYGQYHALDEGLWASESAWRTELPPLNLGGRNAGGTGRARDRPAHLQRSVDSDAYAHDFAHGHTDVNYDEADGGKYHAYAAALRAEEIEREQGRVLREHEVNIMRRHDAHARRARAR